MENEAVIPAVPDNYQFPAEVEYLDTSSPTTSVNTSSGYLNNSNPDCFQSDPVGCIDQGWTLMDLVQMFVVYAFIIAAALAATFIFIGGISFILSGGDDEKIKRAVNTIRYSIIGLIVTILSFTVVTIVGRMFGLNFLDYLSYSQIKDSINRVVSGTSQPSSSFDVER